MASALARGRAVWCRCATDSCVCASFPLSPPAPLLADRAMSAPAPAAAGSAVSAAAAAPPTALGKLGMLRLDADYKHDGSLGVGAWLAANAAAALGRSDFTLPIKVSLHSTAAQRCTAIQKAPSEERRDASDVHTRPRGCTAIDLRRLPQNASLNLLSALLCEPVRSSLCCTLHCCITLCSAR